MQFWFFKICVDDYSKLSIIFNRYILKLNIVYKVKEKGEAFPLNLGGKITPAIRTITKLKPTQRRKRKKESIKIIKRKAKL